MSLCIIHCERAMLWSHKWAVFAALTDYWSCVGGELDGEERKEDGLNTQAMCSVW